MTTKWQICCNCEGEGKHSKRLGTIDVNEWDTEALACYMNGDYDEPCEVCQGSGKVKAGLNRTLRYYATDEEYYWKREGGY